MSNLEEKRNISRREAFVPKRGHLSVRTGQPRKHPRVNSNAADWDRSSGDSREKPNADGRRGRRPLGQMVLPGFGSSSLNGMTNSRFTFDQFVVGPGNRFAYAAAWAVANDKRNGYNPLFLYAQSGMGKSHLSCAIGNRILATRPSTRILYATAEEFFNEMVK